MVNERGEVVCLDYGSPRTLAEMAKTCYYELLGVERNANDSELKKAYRKQALVWHPDRNHGNAEEATQVFAEIREAYETLSDPNERAWYDDHREQILRGDDYAAMATASDGYAQNNPDASVSFTSTSVLMRYFSVSSFSGFDDSTKGFFAVYRSLFDTLRDEELQVVDAESEDRLDLIRNLSFGDTHTLYDEDEMYARMQGTSGSTGRRGEGTGSTLRDFYNFWTTFTTRKSFGWFDRYRLADADNRQIRRLMEKENRHLRDKAKREFVDAVQNLAAWLKRRDPRYKRYVEEKQQQQQQQELNRKRRVLEQRAAVVDGAGSYVCQAWEEVDYTSVLDDLLGEDPETTYDKGTAVDGCEQPSHSDNSADEDELFCPVCDKEFKSAAQKVNHKQSKKHQKAVRAFRREIQREERLLAKTQNASAGEATENLESIKCEEAEAEAGATGESDESDALLQMIRELSVTQAAQGKKSKKGKRRWHQQEQQLVDEPTLSAPSEDLAATQRPSKREQRRQRQKAKTHDEYICNTCTEGFASRNQLFKHINDTGHALAGSRASGGAATPKNGKRVGR
ncbi:hypothetical protein H4S08_004575 [Coemansia sp. RSA 1365]|nr:hypothetical protein H4S08_004575 [Coemansia sp. RSA 1365]